MLVEPQNASQFKAEFDKASAAIVYLTATWCGPCRAIAPVFKNLSDAQENSNITFFKVDIDACPDLEIVKGVQGVPTFIAYKNGALIEKFTGANKSSLEALVKKLH
ncbi:hypothetical protein RB653_008029 [Dictyostelium firmibasis]|uniref:Thioredoxin n=1 Tax=Dictyostelium firmibasis TaxID=79012 RepID=A0AAN7YNY2_9MYCE